MDQSLHVESPGKQNLICVFLWFTAMHIIIKLFGQLALRYGKGITVDVEDSSSLYKVIRTLFSNLGLGEVHVREGYVETRLGITRILLNGKEAAVDTRVVDGDEIFLVPPVAGGGSNDTSPEFSQHADSSLSQQSTDGPIDANREISGQNETRPSYVWISRDDSRCSGCRRCEIACSLHHEGRIWPEASRIRVFMLLPGVEIPHLCAQCPDYPCVKSCPTEALSINHKTGAVIVDKEKCTACGICTKACPGKIPHLHPNGEHILICDLCDGDPQCVKVCNGGGWNALRISPKPSDPTLGTMSIKLYAKDPDEATKELAVNLFGEAAEEIL